MAKLILRGDGADQEFSLDDSGSLTIGRSPECDITIDDGQASRRHCSVVKLQSGYEVADLGSTNGTLVNSTLVKKKKLVHGDVIRIGAQEIAFSDPTATAAGGEEITNCFLVYAKGDRKGEKVELTQQRTTIGRKGTNTLPLEDPVCSSYHAEIVRDLNGYTIRDLGSTNGTLMNGEMITESQLTHGARIRIGNVRFVFQDPAMAEIDLELAGAEDDDEWAMMRELDLSAVRRRNPATIIYGALFLAILGGLYLLTQMKTGAGGPKGPQAPENNLVDDFSFESVASRFAWESEPAGTVSMSVSGKWKGQGESALEMRSNTEAAEAFYGRSRPSGNAKYTLEAKVSARGATALPGLLWTGLGLERWAAADPITGTSDVSLQASAPFWATRVRLGMRIEGQGTVYLDDVVFLRTGGAAVDTIEKNSFLFSAVDGSVLDVAHAGAPILAHGRPFARNADGDATDVAPTVRIEAKDDEHVIVTVEGAGAAVLGIEFDEVNGYLSRGGFRAFTPDEETPFHAAFPDEGELVLKGVRKLLLGPSGRALAVVAATDEGRLHAEARVDGKRRAAAVLGPATDGALVFRCKVDLRGEAKTASDTMARALNLHSAARYGEFLDEANRALAEFPFANPMMRRQLSQRVAQVNQSYAELRKRAEKELRDYREFKDLQSLDNARDIFETLVEEFQVAPGEGPRGEHLAQLMAEESRLRTAALRKQQGEQARSRLEQAIYVHVPQGEVYSAAVLLTYVKWNLPAVWSLPESDPGNEMNDLVREGRAALAKIEKEHPEVIEVLKRLQ